jgi:NADPH:quinone reductase-like Zn-dependent oxidoreductase
MRIESFELSDPGANEVKVRVVAASINPFDWRIRNGEYRFLTGFNFPRGIGSDFAGVVESVGSRVTKLRAGDRVVGSMRPQQAGALSPVVIAPEKRVVKIPASLDFEAAATLPIPAITAWLALIKKANIQPGQNILLNGALGAVGRASIAIAKLRGVRITGRVGKSHFQAAQQLGLDKILDYASDVPRELDHSFDVVFDCNGSLSPAEADRLLKPGGVVFDINLTNKNKLFRALFTRRQKLIFFNGDAKALAEVVELADQRRLVLPIANRVTLDEAIPLLVALERGQSGSTGKSIVLFSQQGGPQG